MKNIYLLKNGIVYNPTGKKFNLIASPADNIEISQHADYFVFDFLKLKKEGVFVYKLYKENEEHIIQGLVAFKPSIGVLDCYNMETNLINKKPLLLYDGVGKSMVALCCKISVDLELDGFITFEAKNKLIPYYKRLGATLITGLRMAIDDKNAKKLIDIYF